MASIKRVIFAVTLLVVFRCAMPNGQQVNLKIPEACNKSGFCSIKPEGYDKLEEQMNKLLYPGLIKSFSNRIGQMPEPEYSPENEKHNCPYIRKWETSYIFLGNNASQVDIIVQTKFFSQPYETIICDNEKIREAKEDVDWQGECFSHLRLPFQFRCKTSEVSRLFLVYDLKTKFLKSKNFKVPCCCTCEIED